MQTERDIITYYQSSQWLYRLFCYDGQTLGMHYGFWESGTANRQQAIANQHQEVIVRADITAKEHVLDVGCGVGGAAIHIAQTTGARVTGVTLDPKQVRLAARYAQSAGVADLVDFQVMDFAKLGFADGNFDVVYGIESICYAHPKQVFLKEAFRVLKPGGWLVIMDGYAARLPNTSEEQVIRRGIEWGFVLAPIVTGKHMKDMIGACGFKNVQQIDKTQETWPSVRYFGRLATLVMPIAKALALIPSTHLQAIYRNAVALRGVMRSYEQGLGEYAIHIGEKPRR